MINEAYAHMYPDQDISLAVDYGTQWQGEVLSFEEPFIAPEDSIRESNDANPMPIRHMVRIDGIPYDDEALEMGADNFRLPLGAAMPSGTLEPLDDYRLVYDGSHA